MADDNLFPPPTKENNKQTKTVGRRKENEYVIGILLHVPKTHTQKHIQKHTQRGRLGVVEKME